MDISEDCAGEVQGTQIAQFQLHCRTPKNYLYPDLNTTRHVAIHRCRTSRDNIGKQIS